MNFFKKLSKQVVNEPEAELKVTPPSVGEMEEAIAKRIRVIKREFTDGFNFIKNHTRSVTFFGSARFDPDHPFYRQAEDLAARLSKAGFTIVTGGGPGIMQAANQGANEAGGQSLGLTISLPNEQITNPYLTDYIGFNYFFTRKVCLSFSAKAFIYFPGGFGTLDELFEIITLVQTMKIPPVPIILVGSEFWQPLADFIRRYLLEKNQTISSKDLDLFIITDDLAEVVEVVKRTI
ncbi:MAG: TIGR00730 family Rossman fold protein [Candidatus Paceibacterota bacterium]